MPARLALTSCSPARRPRFATPRTNGSAASAKRPAPSTASTPSLRIVAFRTVVIAVSASATPRRAPTLAIRVAGPASAPPAAPSAMPVSGASGEVDAAQRRLSGHHEAPAGEAGGEAAAAGPEHQRHVGRELGRHADAAGEPALLAERLAVLLVASSLRRERRRVLRCYIVAECLLAGLTQRARPQDKLLSSRRDGAAQLPQPRLSADLLDRRGAAALDRPPAVARAGDQLVGIAGVVVADLSHRSAAPPS